MHSEPELSFDDIKNLVFESVYEYLDLFGTRHNFTAQIALKAMYHHFKEVSVEQLHFPKSNKGFYSPGFDDLLISIRHETFHGRIQPDNRHNGTNQKHTYCVLYFQRNSYFYEDEIVQLKLKLYFEDDKDLTKRSVKLSRMDLTDNVHSYEEKISEIETNAWFEKSKNKKPLSYEININYDFSG